MRVSAALAVAAFALALVATAALASPHAHLQRRPTHPPAPERKSFNGFWLTGLLPAAMTAFGADGALNLTAVPLQAAALKAQGVQYVFVGGTTSECLSLTTDERERLVEAWAKQLTPNGLQLVVHVGAEALRDAVRLAKHAVAHGAIAVAAFPPIYFKPSGLNALVETMAQVAAAVPDTPFIYYHFPAMTGSLVGSGIVPFVEAAASAIPNFHGVKFTDSNLLDAATIVRWANPSNGQQYQVLLGKDELMADGLLYGCDGFIGSTFGYAAPLYFRLIDAWRAGNTTGVQLEQTRAQQFIDVFSAYNAGDNIRGNKPLMGLKLGIDMGAPRLPQQPITAAELQDLQQQLQAIGFFHWSS